MPGLYELFDKAGVGRKMTAQKMVMLGFAQKTVGASSRKPEPEGKKLEDMKLEDKKLEDKKPEDKKPEDKKPEDKKPEDKKPDYDSIPSGYCFNSEYLDSNNITYLNSVMQNGVECYQFKMSNGKIMTLPLKTCVTMRFIRKK